MAQYVCLFLTTMFLLLIFADDFLGLMFAVMFCWLFLPALAISAISLVCSIRCNTRHKRILLIGHIINILIFAFVIFNPDNRCDANVMEEHYKEYGGQMEKLHRSVCDQLKPNTGIALEFERGQVSIFHILNENGEGERCWNPSEQKTDSLLSQAGLNRKQLKDIERKLKEIHCISIEVQARPDAPYAIGFRRVGMGMYRYRLYPKPLSLDEQKKLNDDCSLIVYSPHVVFEYGSGAIGSDCFPGKEEYLKGKAGESDP